MIRIRLKVDTNFTRIACFKVVLVTMTAIIIGLSSCNKGTEWDGFVPKVPLNHLGPTPVINNDTIGVDQFIALKYLGVIWKEQRVLYMAKQLGLYEIEGVALPESDNPLVSILDTSLTHIIFDCSNKNYFFGYPSAVQTTAGTIIVAEKRVSETETNSFSDDIFFTNTGTGYWSETDFFKFGAYGLSWNGTRPLLGKLPDGRVVMKGKGLLVSDLNNGFQKWANYPYAFQDLLNMKKQFHNCGPTMTYSSKFGLFFGVGQATVDTATYSLASLFSVDPDHGKVTLAKTKWMPKIMKVSSTLDTSMVYISSIDQPSFYSVEHSDLSSHKNDIVGLGISDLGNIYQYVYNYKAEDGASFDSIHFLLAKTNIQASLIRQSPISIEYNHVTGRFEILVSQPDRLSLWSISVNDLLNNVVDRSGVSNWTKEVDLLIRDNVDVFGQGLFPVSSIIDETANTQTVYFQAGCDYPARSGLFKLKRTLDTPKLVQAVAAKRAALVNVIYENQ